MPAHKNDNGFRKSTQRNTIDNVSHFQTYKNGEVGSLLRPEPLSGSMYALGEISTPDGSKGKFILKDWESRRRRRLNNRTRILLVLLLLFIALSIIMAGLFTWAVMKPRYENQILKTNSQEPRPKNCSFLPKPVAFKTLPTNVKELLKEFEKFIKKEIERGEAAALSANLVYVDSVIWERGFGLMDHYDNSSKSPTPKTVYPSASLSKILTSLMLFKLHDNGKIASFDVPLKTYEPGFSIKNPFHRNITIKDVASQRSGLPREAPCFPSSAGNLCPYTYPTMLQRISKISLLREPGTEPQYSNLGWSLLGQILAKYFGRGDYRTWMKKTLLDPLGMTSSTFALTESLRSQIPVVHPSADTIRTVVDWGWLAPAGGLYSTVHDLAQMEIKLFSQSFLDSDVTEKFFKEDFVFPDGVTMTGMPWEIKFYNGRLIREKIASVYGYESYVGAVPEMKLAFNFMCAKCKDALETSLQNYFRKIITTMDIAIKLASPKVYHLPPDTRIYTGIYSADNTLPMPLQMEIRVHNKDRLSIAINGGTVDVFFLNYVQPRVFRVRLNPHNSCDKLYTFGVEDSLVLFDKPSVSSPGGLSGGFTMDSAHPSGRTYFARKV